MVERRQTEKKVKLKWWKEDRPRRRLKEDRQRRRLN